LYQSNYGLDQWEVLRRQRLQNSKSNQANRNARNSEAHASSLENKLRVANDYKDWYEMLLGEAGTRLCKASTGITVAGFTNNPAFEIEHLIGELLGISDFVISDPIRYCKRRDEIITSLTDVQKKDVNLKLLCRMEWIDWCLQVDVLAKFGAEVTNAFINPNDDNKILRNKSMLSFYTKASKEYHTLRELAMNPDKGESIRAQFEQGRYDFWKNKIQYKHFEGGYVLPSSDLTIEAHPDISLDSHLIAGQIIERFEINIGTLKKGVCYRTRLAQSIPNGMQDGNIGRWYI